MRRAQRNNITVIITLRPASAVSSVTGMVILMISVFFASSEAALILFLRSEIVILAPSLIVFLTDLAFALLSSNRIECPQRREKELTIGHVLADNILNESVVELVTIF